MVLDHTTDEQEMRAVWCWALSWLCKPPSDADRRERQVMLIVAIKPTLDDVQTVRELHALYERGNRWALAAARREAPQDWYALGMHALTAAAYGIRYVELMTGKWIDPVALPSWVGEFAIW